MGRPIRMIALCTLVGLSLRGMTALGDDSVRTAERRQQTIVKSQRASDLLRLGMASYLEGRYDKALGALKAAEALRDQLTPRQRKDLETYRVHCERLARKQVTTASRETARGQSPTGYTLPTGQGQDRAAYRKDFARRMVAKAQAELNRGNIDGAEYYALRAKAMGQINGQPNQTAEQILEKVAGLKQRAVGGAPLAPATPQAGAIPSGLPANPFAVSSVDEASAQTTAPSVAKTIEQRDLVAQPTGVATKEASSAKIHQLSGQWTAQARRLLSAGHLEEARALAEEARKLGAQHTLFEDTPRKVLEGIALAESSQPKQPVVVAAFQESAEDQTPVATPLPVAAAPGFAAVEGQASEPLKLQAAEGSKIDSSTPAPLPQVVAVSEVSASQVAFRQADEAQRQQLLVKKVRDDVVNALIRANEVLEQDPERSLSILDGARQSVAASEVSENAKSALLSRIVREVNRVRQYGEQHASEIDLKRSNQATTEMVAREQSHRIEVQQEVAGMVEQFNTLMEEGRYAEAELLAKRAGAMDPGNPVTETMVLKAQMVGRFRRAHEIDDLQAKYFLDAMESVEESAIGIDDRHPFAYPPIPEWRDLTERRRGETGREERLSSEELKIQRSLNETVSLNFDNAPLSQVIQDLAAMADINVVLDSLGLEEEGVETNTPVTIHVEGIRLKSALNLILDALRLKYSIGDDVLKITSESRARGAIIRKTYYVADLVMPIMSFSSDMIGISPGSMPNLLASGGNGAHLSPVSVAAIPTNSSLVPAVDANVLAQMANRNAFGESPSSFGSSFSEPGLPSAVPSSGGIVADFDPLIELIENTIEVDSWDPVGDGTMLEFESSLSLVINTTQDVHEQIAALLEQLRRLQDLQMTIEVRFITLSDDFFERIGVDFDFDINDKTDKPFQTFGQPDPGYSPSFDTGVTSGNPGRDLQDRDRFRSQTIVGQSSPGVFTDDLDIPFRQGSFGVALPAFGGFNPAVGASMGFAILSDIEAFLFINAATQDNRTNVMNAPKITLFNGTSALVFELTNRFFLLGQRPIVGAGAVGFEPNIQAFPEGTMLQVSGVISADRRYVRVRATPIFFQIRGFTTIETSAGVAGGGFGGGGAGVGTQTIQLPELAITAVLTEVSVPDGGTILLGGIKRMSENRIEAGVPILNKIPYISRLFKNVGVGRSTTSLMMMVTPRIIIQEEEESLLGITDLP